MYNLGEDDYDFIKKLRKRGDKSLSWGGTVDKKIKIKKEVFKMVNIVRLEIGQYEFVELDLDKTDAELAVMLSKAMIVQSIKNGEERPIEVALEEVKPSPIAKPKAVSKPKAMAKASPKPVSKPSPAKRPAPAGKKDNYEFLTINKEESFVITPKEATGSHKGNYGLNYFYVVEVDGDLFKVSVGEKTAGGALVGLLNQCVESDEEFEFVLGKTEKGVFYAQDSDGESLL